MECKIKKVETVPTSDSGNNIVKKEDRLAHLEFVYILKQLHGIMLKKS